MSAPTFADPTLARQIAWSPYLPMKIAAAYLAGTYALFLATGPVGEVPDLLTLSLFIAATIVAFLVGYGLQAGRNDGIALNVPVVQHGPPEKLIIAASVYYVLLGLALIRVAGIDGAASLARAIGSPADSYYAGLHRDSQVSPTIQVLTVVAVLYTLLVPISVVYWSRLRLLVRCLVAAGLLAYACYYLAIGTLKGIGDLIIFWLGATLVARQWRGSTRHGKRNVRHWVVLVGVIGIFLGYMSFNLSERLRERDQLDDFPPNPIVAAIAGDAFASGVSAAAYYPTHGYLGLGYNLETPFVWTEGLGSSPALASYWEAYLGDGHRYSNRYTARTERLSGWPDGMLWSTIYPWLASDLSWFGAILFMGVVGWFLAKSWREAVRARRTLSLALFCQLALLIAFVPANNQIGQGRISLIGFMTLSAASILDRFRNRPSAAQSSWHDRIFGGGPAAR